MAVSISGVRQTTQALPKTYGNGTESDYAKLRGLVGRQVAPPPAMRGLHRHPSHSWFYPTHHHHPKENPRRQSTQPSCTGLFRHPALAWGPAVAASSPAAPGTAQACLHAQNNSAGTSTQCRPARPPTQRENLRVCTMLTFPPLALPASLADGIVPTTSEKASKGLVMTMRRNCENFHSIAGSTFKNSSGTESLVQYGRAWYKL